MENEQFFDQFNKLNFIGLTIGENMYFPKVYTPVINPTTEEIIANVASANEQHLDIAVNIAESVFQKWSSFPIEIRQEYLLQLAMHIEKKKRNLPILSTLSKGSHIFLRLSVKLNIQYSGSKKS